MSSFGGTVKLTGESEYRAALKEISSNLKVLNSEMKAVTSEYDRNDKSVENLSSQNEVLNKKIDEQKKKVSVLSDALEKSKAETGENSETTKKWQTELNNAQAELNTLNRKVSDNADAMQEAEQGTKEEAEAVEDFGKEAEDSGDKALKLGDIIKANLISDAIKGGLTALVEGFKAIGGAMGECLEGGAAYADNLLTLSVQTGLSTDTLEKYSAVAELTDVSLDTLTKSMTKNIKSMASVQDVSGEAAVDMQKLAKAQDSLKIATNGVEKAQIDYDKAVKKNGANSAEAKKAALALENAQIKVAAAQRNVESASQAVEPKMNAMTQAYTKLGVSVYDAEGNMRDGETVYWEVIDALKEMENETERDALGMQILGKSAQELNTIIEMGSEGVAEYTDMAVNMGAVLGGEGLAALGALDDQMQIFSTTTDATKNILASAFAPAMAGALEGVNALGGAFNGLVAAVISGEGVDEAFYMVSEGLTDLIVGIEEALPQVLTIVGDLFTVMLDLIAEYLPWLIEEGAAMLSSLLSGISQNLGTVMNTVMSVVNTLLTTIIQNLPTIIAMGIQMLTALIKGIADCLPKLIPTIIDAVILITETLLDNLDMLIDAGIELILALADGLIDALPDLVEKIPVIIDKLILAITNNLPKILEAGVTILVKVGEGLVKAIPQLIEKIPQIITSIVKGFKSALGTIKNIGLDLVKGIWYGIDDATSWILRQIKSFGKSVLEGIKSVFGIHSPSKLFKDEVGKNLALGVGEGFADTMSDVSNQMQNAIPTEFDADISTNMSMASGNAQMSNYDMMVSAFKRALTEVKVVLDDREMGGFVTDTVERVVFA